MKLRLAYRGDPARSRGGQGGAEGFGLSLLEQLDELRRRLVYAAAAIGVGMVIAFAYITPIYEFVFRPIRRVMPPGSKLIYTEPGEAFSVYVEIALIAGIVLAPRFSCTSSGTWWRRCCIYA